MKVVIEVLAATAMLGQTCHARMALAIMADTAEGTSRLLGKEDFSAEVDGLRRPLEAPPTERNVTQIRRTVDRDEDIGIFRNRLARHQRADEGNTQNARTRTRSPHERPYSEKQLAARFDH